MRLYHPIVLISFIAVVLFGGIQLLVYKAQAAATSSLSSPFVVTNTPTIANTTVANPTASPVNHQSGWLSASVDKTTLNIGETLTINFTVTNKYDDSNYRTGTITQAVPIAGYGYIPDDTEYAYDQDQCWALQNLGLFPKVPKKFRVMAGYVGWDNQYATNSTNCASKSTIDHPWRWSIGASDMAPGTSRTITGKVRFTKPGTYTMMFGLVKDLVGYPDVGTCIASNSANLNVCGIDTTVITVLDVPTTTPTPSNSPTTTNTRTPSNTSTPSNTATNSKTRTPTNTMSPTKTLTSTRTMTVTEVRGGNRIARFSFEESVGAHITYKNTLSTSTSLICPGTLLVPAITCPVITNTGVDGNSLLYSGAQYSYTKQNISLTSTGGLTIAYWAKPNTGTLMNAVVMGTTTNYIITGFDTLGRFFCSNKVSTLTAPQAIADTNWNHYACSLNSVTKQRTIYVNSLRVAMDPTTAFLTGSATAFVGSNVLKNGAFYDGEIDELSIYNAELTYDDVEFLYLKYINDPTRISPTRTLTPSSTRTLSPTITNTPFPAEIARGNIAWFSFNEATGATSFVNQLSTTNVAECPAPLVCPIAGASGVRFSKGITFTGSQTLKLRSTIDIVASNPFSVAAWINSNYSSNSVIMSARAASPTTNKFILGLNGDGAPFCQYGTSSIEATDQIVSETWLHLICSIDKNRNAVLYLNGAPVASGPMAAMPSGVMNVWIGADGTLSDNYFDGSIDEVSIFNQFVTWDKAEIMYDQYAAAGQRSPTRSRTATITHTPSKTLTPSKTGTATVSLSPISNGSYPYPAPKFTPSITRTSTPSKTYTPLPSKTRTETPNYPYP